MSKNWSELRSRSELQNLLDREDAFSTSAKPTSWGYFVQLKAMGYFCWFEQAKDMLMHLAQVEILHSPNHVPERAEYEKKVLQVIPIVQTWIDLKQSSTETCAALNQIFPDFSIGWLGNFEGLCHGTEAFEKKVREAFQQQDGIPVNQQPAFIDFLENYGI